MAESAAYARRHHKGGCVATTIPAGLNAGALSATLADASTWAGGVANGNTRAMINRTGATPEEIEISAITGNDITISARGLQGTSDVTHTAGASIEIVSSPRDFNEANYAVTKTVGKITTAGDLLYGDAANSLTRLGIGTARQALATNAGATAPQWVASIQSLLTTQGDVIYASAANTPARLAKGTASQVLTMNAGATAPEWAAAASGFSYQTATVATLQTTTSAAFADLATVGPAVTLTTGTTALVIMTAFIFASEAGQSGLAGFAVSGATTRAASDSTALDVRSASATGTGMGASRVAAVTGLTAGSNTFTLKYRMETGTTGIEFSARQIVVIPI